MLGVSMWILSGVIAMVSGAATDDFGEAKWLRDPVFKGVEIIDLFHREQAEKPELSGPRNVHTLLRKQITLPETPAAARLVITGDDYYTFHINDAFVVQGPEPGYPFAHPYYRLDVTGAFQAGDNTLAAHVFYQGLLNRVWNSADNRSGFMMALTVTYADGRSETFVTDESWKLHTLTAFPTGRTLGYDTQFAEDIDMRLMPAGWRANGFDDSRWKTPLCGRQDHVFVEQMTPPLEHWRADPQVVKKKGKGHYFYDFGQEIVGHTRIRLQGPKGHKIEVRHGEELSAPDTVRYEMRAKCVYQEFPILSGRRETIEFFDYRAFRYMEILNAPEEPELWVEVRHHPFDPEAATFEASDELLTAIWQLCKNGVQFGAQGGFLDCPSREKGQYLGDALITGHSHVVLTGNRSLLAKSIQDFAHSRRICPGLMAVAPGSLMQEIAEYSLQWPLVLRTYYDYTGDAEFTQKMLDDVLPGLFAYFEKFESEGGLISGMTEKWVLVDWPDNLRDGFDYDYAKERENAVLNAFYYASLKAAAGLCRDLGRESAAYEQKAAHVREAFVQRLLDADSRLFVDAPGSTHSSLHANALPLAFGLAPEESVPAIVELIRQKRLSCGVYIAPFVIEACYRAGEAELAYDLITSKDEHSWHEMLKHGATTCMEAWGPDQKWNTSWCHPWSSSPVYLITERVAGLRPAEPGWRRIAFEPKVPDSLENFELQLTIPQGALQVKYTQADGFALTTPPGVPVRAELPEDVKLLVTHAPQPLSPRQRQVLDPLGWQKRVGQEPAVWVSVDEQVLRVVHGDAILWESPCATAEKGTGSEIDSFKTPLGWHEIFAKTGRGAPWGQVFRGGVPTAHVWKPGHNTREDLVLTRILFLDGLEPGRNKGGNVDSRARYIYIHGTNDEAAIGTPSSQGCVRLRNDDIIALYELVPEGAKVLITETPQAGD
ncbi:MAG: family 78 glycoside hydrolase catalytic domain [Candidatus Hydrogenedentales bacterium]